MSPFKIGQSIVHGKHILDMITWIEDTWTAHIMWQWTS